MTIRSLFILLVSWSCLLLVSGAKAQGSALLSNSWPKVHGDRLVFEANDAGDEISMTLAEYERLTGHSFLLQLTSFFDFKKTFAEVSSYLTETLEEDFDVFFLVNVDFQSRYRETDFVPAQRMRVLRKKYFSQPVFARNQEGVVTGFNPEVLGVADGTTAFSGLPQLMKISSGAGHFSHDETYVDTPTGIYRINDFLSARARYGKGMYHSLFLDLRYPWTTAPSGLAIHGTDSGQNEYLGTQRSHGCIRITKAQANILYENIIVDKDRIFRTETLADLDKFQRLKSEMRGECGEVITRPGRRALIIIFYGYDRAPAA